METRDDGQSRHYCFARTCRPYSELTCQLVWEHFDTDKWESLCKDPAVTSQEAADPNLLLQSYRRFLSGSISASITFSPLSELCRGRIAAPAEWRLSVALLCLGRKQRDVSIPTSWVGVGKTGPR